MYMYTIMWSESALAGDVRLWDDSNIMYYTRRSMHLSGWGVADPLRSVGLVPLCVCDIPPLHVLKNPMRVNLQLVRRERRK